jgi:hypothetical protein
MLEHNYTMQGDRKSRRRRRRRRRRLNITTR